METIVIELEDGLGIPIPDAVAQSLGLQEGELVSMDSENGAIVLRPAQAGCRGDRSAL